jgi:hypothetical protein
MIAAVNVESSITLTKDGVGPGGGESSITFTSDTGVGKGKDERGVIHVIVYLGTNLNYNIG